MKADEAMLIVAGLVKTMHKTHPEMKEHITCVWGPDNKTLTLFTTYLSGYVFLAEDRFQCYSTMEDGYRLLSHDENVSRNVSGTTIELFEEVMQKSLTIYKEEMYK